MPVTDHFSDGQKRTMLENAVAPIDELRQIMNNADLEKTKTGQTLTFSEYTSLLLSASAAYDEEFKPKASKQRHVYAHDIGDDYDYSDDHHDAGLTRAAAPPRSTTTPSVSNTTSRYTPADLFRTESNAIQVCSRY